MLLSQLQLDKFTTERKVPNLFDAAFFVLDLHKGPPALQREPPALQTWNQFCHIFFLLGGSFMVSGSHLTLDPKLQGEKRKLLDPNFFHPGCRVKKISDPGSSSENLSIFNPQNCF
jgi:hypothetical protein